MKRSRIYQKRKSHTKRYNFGSELSIDHEREFASVFDNFVVKKITFNESPETEVFWDCFVEKIIEKYVFKKNEKFLILVPNFGLMDINIIRDGGNTFVVIKSKDKSIRNKLMSKCDFLSDNISKIVRSKIHLVVV